MKYKITIAFLLFFSAIIAQEEVLRIENNLKTTDDLIEKTFAIIDESSNNLTVFLQDSDSIYAYLYDNKFELINTLKSENLARKYDQFLGSNVSNDRYNLFMSNKKNSAFGLISFLFEKQKASITEIDLKLSEESFLQAITHKNKFYILTATENGLNLYVFNNQGNFEKKSFDYSDKRFLSNKNSLCTFNYCLAGYSGIPKTIEIQKIKSNNPNSIEVTSERIKMYVENNIVTISIDNASGFTQLIKINLEDFTSIIDNVQKPYVYSSNESYIKSNSFIDENNILQIVSTRDELSFSIKDLKTKNTIKEYRLKDNDSITFKNSPIIQEGGVYDKYRELEKTKKFLRKITAYKIGISVYKINNQHQITLGGKKQPTTGVGTGMGMPMGMAGFGGIPIAGFGGFNVFFDPTMFAYNSYSNTVSTFINCLFDENYEHVEGEIKDNVFDKISDFKEEKERFINAETIFRFNNNLYFGTCFGDKNYIIIQFND